MRPVAKKCLLLKCEEERTNQVILERLKGIRASLAKLAGVLQGLEGGRVERNPRYWQNTLIGWGDHLETVNKEMTIIYTDLLKKLS